MAIQALHIVILIESTSNKFFSFLFGLFFFFMTIFQDSVLYFENIDAIPREEYEIKDKKFILLEVDQQMATFLEMENKYRALT